MFSQTAEYALRAAVMLAEPPLRPDAPENDKPRALKPRHSTGDRIFRNTARGAGFIVLAITGACRKSDGARVLDGRVDHGEHRGNRE